MKPSNRHRHLGGGRLTGYCVICGNYGQITQDHVPPKGAITISKTEQHHISERIGLESQKKIKGAISNNGSKFKTICATCNNQHIGGCDDHIKKAHYEITQQIRSHFSSMYNMLPLATCSINAISYARGMIGHILSATSSTECRAAPQASEYFDPLAKFVLGDDAAVNNTHDLYYWFYPYERHVSAKLVSFYNEGHVTKLSLLAFFPIAFMVSEKNRGTFPRQAKRLRFSDKNLYLDLSLHNISYSKFPFHNIEGDQKCLFPDKMCITSKPIK